MEYRMLESRLVQLHGIDEAGMGAFRARLRVLKSMGVPDKPKVGKGTRLSFDVVDLWEMHVALTLTELGLSPSKIVTTVQHLRMNKVFHRVKKAADERWLIVLTQSDVGRQTDAPQSFHVAAGDYSFDELPAILKKNETAAPMPVWQSLINVSRLVRDVQ